MSDVPHTVQRTFRPTIHLLIVDLDNTLFDWVGAWFHAYDPLVSELADALGVDRGHLERELKSCHERRGSSEYRDALAELPSACGVAARDSAVAARASRSWADAVERQRRFTACYPTVRETLARIHAAGCCVVVSSESPAREASWRVERLALSDVIDGVSCDPGEADEWRSRGHRPVVTAAQKPDPRLVDDVLEAYGVSPAHAAFVGDNRHKDVAMALAAGIHAVWAVYGAQREPAAAALLERLCHWRSGGGDHERYGSPPAAPYELRERFAEILGLFTFSARETGT